MDWFVKDSSSSFQETGGTRFWEKPGVFKYDKLQVDATHFSPEKRAELRDAFERHAKRAQIVNERVFREVAAEFNLPVKKV